MNISDYNSLKNSDEQHFWYQARKIMIDRLLGLYLKEGGGREILNIGAGLGTEAVILKKYGRLTALDKDPETVALSGRSGIRTVLGDIEEIEPEKNIYDYVCCFDILEHLRDDRAALKKIYRALPPGGYLFFTVPAYGFLWSGHDLVTGHKRRYARGGVKKMLSEAGFEIPLISYWNSLLLPPVIVYRLAKKASGFAPKTDARPLPRTLNRLLFFVLNLENNFIGRNIPFGLSIYGAARKKI
ncbi:MAG: class I SAM-dependent methyltransferase [Candidatus Falkowbacteria bacterium]